MRPLIRTAGKHRCHLFGRLNALLLLTRPAAAEPSSFPKKAVQDSSATKIRQLLSDDEVEDSDAVKTIFKTGKKAVPTLVAALQDSKDDARAVWALVYLGGPKERKLLLDAVVTEKNKEKKSFMSSFIAEALVEPESEEEWNFLAICVKGYKDEDQNMAASYATLALGENGSERALHIIQTLEPLEQPQDPDSDVGEVIREMRQASHWIRQKSANKTDIPTERRSDAERIKQIVLANAFYAEGERTDLSVEDVVFTEDKSRALVSVEIYHGPKNARGYDIVLERRAGRWKIMGIWFTWIS